MELGECVQSRRFSARGVLLLRRQRNLLYSTGSRATPAVSTLLCLNLKYLANSNWCNRTVGFVIFFSSFLLNCIDYGRIKPEGVTRLSDVVVSKCFSRFSGAAFMFYLLFGTYYLTQVASFVFEVIRLLDMYRFYTYLLGIPDVSIS